MNVHTKEPHMEDELEQALNEAVHKTERAVMKRSLTDKNIDNIESVIGQLRSNLLAIEGRMVDLQDQHRQTRRSIEAFTLALKMLQS
jgi:hypothetical protein